MGARSRKRSRSPQPRASESPAPAPVPRRRSSEERADELRAQLAPLGPNEWPLPLIISIVTAAALTLINTILYIAGVGIAGKHPPVSTLLYSVVLGMATYGLIRKRYWAVLGFQALLGLIVLIFCLFLIRASNVEALVISLAVVGFCGWLFYRMIRVMARIQMPERP